MICAAREEREHLGAFGHEEGQLWSTYREEPMEVLDVLTWDVDVHSPKTGDQVHLQFRIVVRRRLGLTILEATHGNEHSTKRSELGEDIVDLVVGVGPREGTRKSVSSLSRKLGRPETPKGRVNAHLNRNLSQVVGMGTRENLLVVRQVLRRGGDMILNIGEVETLRKMERSASSERRCPRANSQCPTWAQPTSSRCSASTVP